MGILNQINIVRYAIFIETNRSDSFFTSNRVFEVSTTSFIILDKPFILVVCCKSRGAAWDSPLSSCDIAT